MELKEWLTAERGRTVWLARKLNVLHTQVSKYSHGKQRIPAERAIDIERLTDGHVHRSDMRPDLWPCEEHRGAA